MNTDAAQSLILPPGTGLLVPAIIADAGGNAARRFIEFFTASIRNPNTRVAYAQAVRQFFTWCDGYGLTLEKIEPVYVGTYIEQHQASIPTVKQHLAALRMLFDYLVVGQIIPTNPAASVKSPRYSISKGKTPVLSAEEARTLLDSIPIKKVVNDVTIDDVVGLRDRALIGAMVYSFARVSAIINMTVGDYYATSGKRYYLRLHEKGGKYHEVPAHLTAQEYLDAYLEAAGIAGDKKTPLFRSVAGGGRSQKLSERALDRLAVWFMIRRRAKAAGINPEICCHTFRATGITAYLSNGGTLDVAQQIAAHASSQTTRLYDRRTDQLKLEEINRIMI